MLDGGLGEQQRAEDLSEYFRVVAGIEFPGKLVNAGLMAAMSLEVLCRRASRAASRLRCPSYRPS